MIDNGLKMRVKNFLSLNRVSNSEFARLAGVSAAYVTSIKESISIDVMRELYKINPALSLKWLLLGIGNMYESSDKEVIKLQKENAILTEKVAMMQKIISLYELHNGTKTSN